jgi:hypothetical protein
MIKDQPPDEIKLDLLLRTGNQYWDRVASSGRRNPSDAYPLYTPLPKMIREID